MKVGNLHSKALIESDRFLLMMACNDLTSRFIFRFFYITDIGCVFKGDIFILSVEENFNLFIFGALNCFY